MVGSKCNAGIPIGGGQGFVGKFYAIAMFACLSASLDTTNGPNATHVFDVQAQNIHNCKENLKQNQCDLELVKDSITTVEVCLLFMANPQS